MRTPYFRTFRAPGCASRSTDCTSLLDRTIRRRTCRRARFSNLLLAVMILLSAACGCSITGNWERVETDPPGVPFPVDEVTFSDTNEYAARYQQYGRTQLSVGTYKLFGTRLDVQQYGSKPLRYNARVRRDGLLELVYSHEGQKVKALLRRKDETRESDAADDAEIPSPATTDPAERESGKSNP